LKIKIAWADYSFAVLNRGPAFGFMTRLLFAYFAGCGMNALVVLSRYYRKTNFLSSGKTV